MKKILFIILLSYSGFTQAQITLNSPIVEAGQFSADGKQYKIVGGKHVPYTNAADFLATIPNTRRHIGQIAYVYDSSGIVTWQFVGGIADSNFRKIAGGGIADLFKKIGTDSIFYTKNGVNVFAYKDSSYNQPLLHRYSVPFVGADGKLMENNSQFKFDGSNLTVGAGDFYSYSGLLLNDGRAFLGASGFGAAFYSPTGGRNSDPSKHIRFYNADRQYLDLNLPAGPTQTTPLEGTVSMNWSPSLNDSFNIGSPSKRWKNGYFKNIWINGALFNPDLSGSYIPLTDKAANNGVATLDAAGKVPLSQLPALTTNKPTYVQTLAEMLANDSASIGDIEVVGDSSKSYALMQLPSSTFGNWLELQSPIPTSTDLLAEGTTNKYYTDARSRGAISNTGRITYNNSTGVIGITSPDWDVPGDVLNKPVIPLQFNPYGSSHVSVTGTYPDLTFDTKNIYDNTQSDSITAKLRSEIQVAAGGGVTLNQLDSAVSGVNLDKVLLNGHTSIHPIEITGSGIISKSGTGQGAAALQADGDGNGLIQAQAANGTAANFSTTGIKNVYNNQLKFSNWPDNAYMVSSVNGQVADDNGNITIPTGGSVSNADSLGGKPAGQYADTANYISKAVAAATYALLGTSYTKAESNSLLAGKANDNNVIHRSGADTAAGKKVFTDAMQIKADNLLPGGYSAEFTVSGSGQNSIRVVTYPTMGNYIKIGNGASSLGGIINSLSYNTGLDIPLEIKSRDLILTTIGGVGIGYLPNTAIAEKLDVNGNAKATSFIKSGGTSSQLLAADGSVKSMGIASGNVMDAGRIIDSLSAANARIKSKLDTSYRDPVILKYPLRASLQNDTTVFSIPQTYLDSLLKTTDSLGIGGTALSAGITAYSKDKTVHTMFGGDNGRSITSSANLELNSPGLILLNATTTNIVPGNFLRYDVPDYGNVFDTYIQSYQQITEVNKGVVTRLDTMMHFTPTSLNKSYTQYNSGADSVTADIDAGNMITILNQSTALKIKNPIGNPENGQQLLFQISDNGTARTITWESDFGFDATDAPMPTTTITTKYIYVDCIWNEDAGKYFVMSVKTRDR